MRAVVRWLVSTAYWSPASEASLKLALAADTKFQDVFFERSSVLVFVLEI